MNTFTNAVMNQEVRTKNGMKARKSTANANVDLFFKIGASRGKDIIPSFVAAFVENQEYAMRIAQWARDIRGGAGERKLFRDVLTYLDKTDPDMACKLITKIPEIGRWDDMLIDYTSSKCKSWAYTLYFQAILDDNGLAAKWAPRKGEMARKLRTEWNMTPKQYRKFIVNASKTVEQQMCAKDWDNINFSHVPSLASSRYKTAFYRNAETAFTEYVEKLKAGDKSVKVNAGAVYPYDVLKDVDSYHYNSTQNDHIIAQWNALENFIGDANILPMIDVSGSMCSPAGGWNSKSKTTCMDVAVSLGLYCADKNKGVFQDLILTFSADPQLMKVKGNIIEKCDQLVRSDWGMNTDLHRAFEKVLKTAVDNNVAQKDMPEMMVIFSDMQFDQCTRFDDSAMEMIRRKYETAGYQVPQIVFWNLNAADNVPVKFNEQGVALVSGFSPSIMKAVLAANFEEFTPEAIMLQTIMSERYDLN